MSRYRLRQSQGTQYQGYVSAYAAYKAGVPLQMIDPMQYHSCPVCKKPMKRVETYYGPGWHYDCKCLDGGSEIDAATDPTADK